LGLAAPQVEVEVEDNVGLEAKLQAPLNAVLSV
jgi:hypothetical protein